MYVVKFSRGRKITFLKWGREVKNKFAATWYNSPSAAKVARNSYMPKLSKEDTLPKVEIINPKDD